MHKLGARGLRALDIDFRTTWPRTAEPHVSPVNRTEGFLEGAAGRAAGRPVQHRRPRALYGNLLRAVDLVVWPESAAPVVNLAREHDVCLIPYGGGTNVSDAARDLNKRC